MKRKSIVVSNLITADANVYLLGEYCIVTSVSTYFWINNLLTLFTHFWVGVMMLSVTFNTGGQFLLVEDTEHPLNTTPHITFDKIIENIYIELVKSYHQKYVHRVSRS
jgi:hypothetical protein